MRFSSLHFFVYYIIVLWGNYVNTKEIKDLNKSKKIKITGIYCKMKSVEISNYFKYYKKYKLLECADRHDVNRSGF